MRVLRNHVESMSTELAEEDPEGTERFNANSLWSSACLCALCVDGLWFW